MEDHFNAITDTKELERLLTRSHEQPVIVFKHSTTCPISAAAYDEMARVEQPVALVVVQSARDVSREVETQTGVEHESPQVLVLRNGKAVWNASHRKVKSDAVENAVRANA